MSEAVYRIEDVRDQVLQSIRAHGPSSAPELAERLGLPLYAVSPALESAQIGQLAAPTADGVWRIPVEKLAA